MIFQTKAFNDLYWKVELLARRAAPFEALLRSCNGDVMDVVVLRRCFGGQNFVLSNSLVLSFISFRLLLL